MFLFSFSFLWILMHAHWHNNVDTLETSKWVKCWAVDASVVYTFNAFLENYVYSLL